MASKKTRSAISAEPIKCLWAIACKSSSIDQQRNNISIFDVIDQVNIPENFFEKLKSEGASGVMVPHEVVVVWKRLIPASIDTEEIKFDYAIELIGSHGSAIQSMVGPMTFPAGSERLRLRVEMPGIAVDGPGDYYYSVSYKSPDAEVFTEVFQIPIQVTVKSA